MNIKKTLKTNYYELDWTYDYGETREKVYLAIKGKINLNFPMLYLKVRNVSLLWHKTSTLNIRKIRKIEFLKKVDSHNIAKFYSILPKYNKLLNYSKRLYG